MPRPQFSIRALLWLTLVVAIVLAPVAAVFRHFDHMIRESYRQAFQRLAEAERRSAQEGKPAAEETEAD